MPGRLVIRAVHHETNRTRRVTFTEQVGNLAIGHHAPARNSPDYAVNAFTVLAIVFCLWLQLLFSACARRESGTLG